MRKTLLWIAAGAAVLTTGAAAAQPAQTVPGYYADLSAGGVLGGDTKFSVAGVGSHDEDLKTGAFLGAAIGQSMGNGFAIESEALYLRSGIKTTDVDTLLGTDLNAKVQTWGVLVNAHYAAVPIGPMTASLGGGVGVGQSRYKLAGESESKTGLIWQAVGGLAYPVNPRLSIDLKYRYIRSPELSDSILKVETGSHVLSIGARMKIF